MNKKDLGVRDYERFIRCYRAGHDDFMSEAEQNSRFYISNDQWSAADKQECEQRKTATPTFNYVNSMINTLCAEQMGAVVEASAIPTSSRASSGTATILSKIIRHIERDCDIEEINASVYKDGLVVGRGYWDVRMGFESMDNIFGEVSINRIDPRAVIKPPEARSTNPQDWPDVHIVRYLNLNQIEDKFGIAACVACRKAYADHKLESAGRFMKWYGGNPSSNVGGNIDMTAVSFGGSDVIAGKHDHELYVNIIERQYRETKKVPNFVDLASGERRAIPDTFDGMMIEEYLSENPDTIEVVLETSIVMVSLFGPGGIELFRKKSPHPFFTVFPYFPDYYNGVTASVVGFMIDPQRVYNKSLASFVNMLAASANSITLVNQDAITLSNPTAEVTVASVRRELSQEGGMLSTNDVHNTINRIAPPQVPTGTDNLMYKAGQAIHDVSGVSQYQMGTPREDVSGKMMAESIMAGSSNNLHRLRGFGSAYKRVIQAVIYLIQTYYDTPRKLHIVRGGGVRGTEELEINIVDAAGELKNDLTVGEYGVTIAVHPATVGADNIAFNELLKLRTELGINIPDKTLVEASTLQDKTEVLEAIKASEEAGQQIAEQQASISDMMQQKAAQEMDAKISSTLAKARHDEAAASAAERNAEAKMALVEIEREKLNLKDKELDIEREHKNRIAKVQENRLVLERVQTMMGNKND